MMRLTILLLTLTSTLGYSVLPQRASHFVGRDVSHAAPSTSARSNTRATLEMKKGKANVPPAMRQQYKRSQEMEGYRQEMMDNQKFGPDGFPVFNLFVRTPLKNMWYPCGSFKGDEKSAALAQNFVDDGLLAGISKNQLDSGVGGSLFRDKKRLTETIVRGYPQLRKDRENLEYGYKLSFNGLSKDQESIQIVDIKEQKGWFDGIKSAFGAN